MTDIVEFTQPVYEGIDLTLKMTPDQRHCYEKISVKIKAGQYVDVGDSIEYLFAYQKEFFNDKFRDTDEIKENSLTTGNRSRYLDSLYRSLRKYISMYENVAPKPISYAYETLISNELYTYKKSSRVRTDFQNYLAFLLRHYDDHIMWSPTFLASVTLLLYKTNEETYLDPSFFLLYSWRPKSSYLSSFGKSHISEINEIVSDILKEDYSKNKVNYLYRLFTANPGYLYTFGWFTSKEEDDQLLPENSCLSSEKDKKRLKRTALIAIPSEASHDYLAKLYRLAEDRFRKSKGIPLIGERWFSETLLYKSLCVAFPSEDIKQHASPLFLKQQHYDVYFPEHKLAVEYQGNQHFHPIDFFGGEEGFQNNLERDERKRQLSLENNVHLIEVLPDYDINELVKELHSILTKTHSLSYTAEDSLHKLKKYFEEYSDEKSDDNASEILAQTVQKSLRENSEFNTESINSLAALRPPSSYANPSWKEEDIPWSKRKKFQYRTDDLQDLMQTDPQEALSKGLSLLEMGWYSPDLFDRLAKIYRKLKRYDDEIDLILQMKRDFGYDHLDERLCKLLKKKAKGS